MNTTEISKLHKRAEDLFRETDRSHLKNMRRHMQMKKVSAALSKAEPKNPSNYVWMGIVNHRLGREYEALLCFDKAHALADLQRVQPDELKKRKRDPKAVAVECLLKKVGAVAQLGAVTKAAGNRWSIPVRLGWKALRAIEDGAYETKMHLDCGQLLIDSKGNVVDDRAAELFRVAFASYTGAFEVRRGKNGFTCVYPHQYGRILISRFLKLRRLEKNRVEEHGNQIRREIKIGKYRALVEDYENLFTFCLPRDEFVSLLGLDKAMNQAFLSLKKPSVVVLFNRVVAVRPCEDSDNPDRVLLDPDINRLYHLEFERLRKKISKRKEYPLEEPYEFDYEKSEPLPVIKPLTAADMTDRFEHPAFDFGTGPLGFKAARPEVQGFIKSQYRALLESIWPTKVKGVFNGKPFEGRVMEAATSHYACCFLHDAFHNTMAMSYFDAELTKELMLTTLHYGMQAHGAFPNGRCNTKRADDCFYMLPLWTLYERCRDKEWLSAVYEVIERHDAYWEKYRFIKEVGLYTGRFCSPDYDWPAPGEDINVFSVGLNSTLYMFKMFKARMAKELGKSDAQNLAQAEGIRKKINQLMWDDRRGFFFGYDAVKGTIFQTSSPDCFLKRREFYSLHHLISLYCGVPTQEQAERMMGVLTDPAIFGRFRGVVENASCCGDDRGLRVWPFPNWLVLQGLRMYGLHREADRISTDLYNMCFKAWYVYDDFPECYDPTHGYLPEENPNVGGVGTISVPLLLVLDRIGIYHSSRPENPGFQTRPVKESGIGDVAFRCCIKGEPSQVIFREAHGLTIHKT